MFPGVKRSKPECEHPSPFTTEVKNKLSHIPVHSVRLHGVKKETVLHVVTPNLQTDTKINPNNTNDCRAELKKKCAY
jgi:hypothetical protein